MYLSLYQTKKYSKLYKTITADVDFFKSVDNLKVLMATTYRILKRGKSLDKSYKALISTYLTANQYTTWAATEWHQFFPDIPYPTGKASQVVVLENLLVASPAITPRMIRFYDNEKKQYNAVFEVMPMADQHFMPSPTFATYFRLEEVALKNIITVFQHDSKAKVFTISKLYHTRTYYPNLSLKEKKLLQAFNYMNELKQYFYKHDSTKALEKTKLYHKDIFPLRSYPKLQFQLMDDLEFVLDIMPKDKIPSKTTLNLYLSAMRVCPSEAYLIILPKYLEYLEDYVLQDDKKKNINYLNYYIEGIRLFVEDEQCIVQSAAIIKTTLLGILDIIGMIDLFTSGKQSKQKINDTYLRFKELKVELSKLETLYDQSWKPIFTREVEQDFKDIETGISVALHNEFEQKKAKMKNVTNNDISLEALITFARIPRNRRPKKHRIFTSVGIMVGEILVLVRKFLE